MFSSSQMMRVAHTCSSSSSSSLIRAVRHEARSSSCFRHGSPRLDAHAISALRIDSRSGVLEGLTRMRMPPSMVPLVFSAAAALSIVQNCTNAMRLL